MNTPDRVQFDLSRDERELLRRGFIEWGGPALPTDAMAVAIGFRDIEDLLNEGSRIGEDIRAGRPITKADWRRALLATEIVFASNTVGSGLDWSITTGFQDDETIWMLRSVQRKLGGSRSWLPDSLPTSDVSPAPQATSTAPVSPMPTPTSTEPTETPPLNGLVAGMGPMAKHQQVKRIAEGLALGCLSYGILRLPNDKTALESALNSAWSSWPRAGEFNNVRGITAGNDIWIGMGKSESRKGVTAAWERHSVPHLMPSYADWPVADCLKLIADEKASADDWINLGEIYLRALYRATSTDPSQG